MLALPSFVQGFDAAFAAAGFRLCQAGIVRRYQGSLAGVACHADLSVMMAAANMPAGYVLTVHAATGAPARWVAGPRVPLLLRSGLTALCDPPHGELLRAYDAGWARRFVDHPPTRDALRALLAEVTFLEHRPTGELRLQLQRHARIDVPDLSRLLRAFEVVVLAAASAPAPRAAPARWTDNHALLLAVIAVLVIVVTAAVGLGFAALYLD